MEPATLTAKVRAVGVEETLAKVGAVTKSIQGARAAAGRTSVGGVSGAVGAAESIRSVQNGIRATDEATRETAEFTRKISDARREMHAWNRLTRFSAARYLSMRGMGPGPAGSGINAAVERSRARNIIVPPVRRVTDPARKLRGVGVRARRVSRQIGPVRGGIVGTLILAGLISIIEFFKELKRFGSNLYDIPAVKGTLTAISELFRTLSKYAFPLTLPLEELNNMMEGKPFGSQFIDSINRVLESFGMDPITHPAESPQRRSSWEQVYNQRYSRSWGR